MKRADRGALTLAAMLLYVALPTAFARPKAPTPLKEAVASFNEKVAKYFSKHETMPSIYTKDQFPKTPLTEDEVVAAIRGWKCEEEKADEKTYRIYQRIADSRVLPAGAELGFHFHWYHFHEHDEYEFLVWWIDLDVMTSKNTGYTFRIRDERLDRRRALRPSPGYSWIVDPYSVTPVRQGGQSSRGIIFFIDHDEKGALVVTAAWLWRKDAHDLRFVAFDENAKRYILYRRFGTTHSDQRNTTLVVKRFRLDPGELPASKVQHLGLQAVDEYGQMSLSNTAVRRAREKGIEILPWPQVGRPYEFSLTTTDGQVIDSRKLRGKVLLIDCWASWCGPCMTNIPELKEIYTQWHAKGLEVLCLSFDYDVEAAKTALESHKIPWPMVFVPSDKEVRQLWKEAVRLPPTPRILLIDQRGVLRSDLSPPWDLKEEIGALLQPPSAEVDDSVQL